MLLLGSVLLLYVLSFLAINLEMELERSHYKMVDDDIDTDGLWMARIFSVIPALNTILVICFVVFEKESIFLLKNRKEANKMYKCLGCGVYQRRHQQKGYRYVEASRYSSKKVLKEACCKECGKEVVRIDLYDDKEIVMAKKASLSKSTWLMIKANSEFKKEQKMELIKDKMEDVEINDKQIEAYTRLYEQRMNQYMEHAERIKKDLEKAGKKVEF